MSRALVIEHTTVFDSHNRTLVPDQTVVISGGRISEVTRSPAPYPPGTKVIDGRGKVTIPGLIDAHVHLVHQLKPAAMTAIEILPHFLAAGVTSIRCAGDRSKGQAVAAKYAETYPHCCPRIFLATDGIDGAPPYHGDLGIAVTDSVKVGDVLDRMSAELGRTITTLKIYVGADRPVATTAILEGHRRGMIITAHLGDYRAEDILADGVDCLEHISSVLRGKTVPSQQLTALIATIESRNVQIVPTLVVFRNFVWLSDVAETHPDNERVSAKLRDHWNKSVQNRRMTENQVPENREQRRLMFENYQTATRLLHEAGVNLLVGSDAPEPYCPPGWALHQELELLVASGMSAAAALAAATLQNARIVKMDGLLGSITPGKIADIVILESDPTADVRNARKIYAVIHNGVEVFSLDHKGSLYAIRPDGRMHWYEDEDRTGRNGPNAQNGWAPGSGSQISFGWEIFETVFYGGEGIIYAIRPDGRMYWYKDENRSGANGPNAQSGWAPGSGSQISFGWEIFETVFYGGDGIIYAIRSDGRMHWYKDVNRRGGNGPNAQSGWAPGSGSRISFGWEIFKSVFYGGDGVIYAIRPDGRMHWYKDEDRRGGNGPHAQSGWASGSGNQISFGWEIFESVFYGNDGIMYAIRPDGRMHWYRDENRRGDNGPNAESGWAPGSGNQISFGWEIFQNVFFGGTSF